MCAFSFVSLSLRHEILRADQLMQVDLMCVAKLDTRAEQNGLSGRVEQYQAGAEIAVGRGAFSKLLRVNCGDAAAVICASVCWSQPLTDTRVGLLQRQSRNFRIWGSSPP